MGRQVMQVVLESLETVVVGCDSQGRPVLYNRAARELFGSLLDDTPIEQWPQHLHVTDREGRDVDPGNLSLLRARDGADVHGTEVVLTLAGAAPRSFRVHGGPVDDGGPVAAVVALHETTIQRRAEKLKDCELRVSTLLSKPAPADSAVANTVELIGDMLDWAATEFWTLDTVGQVLRRKHCWAASGHRLPCELPDQLRESEGLPGKAWVTSNPEWSADLHADADTARQASDWGTLNGALAVPVPSGSATLGVLVCYSSNREVPDDTRTAVMTGIAAHLGEFLERRRAEQYAAELDQTRDEYIALVGHELRTPLTSIESYTDMMRTDPDLTAADRTQMLDAMHRNTGRLHALIARLLDVAGARSGHTALHPQRMNLAAVAQAAADRTTGDPLVTLAVNTDPEVIIEGDPDRLGDVIGELLSNAITWAPEHSTVGLTVHADSHTAVLAVTNTGARIHADERDRVFDLLFRGQHAQHKNIPGTGLGLTYARAVIEQHGGTITISEPDEAATTFTVRLPTNGTTQKPPQEPADAIT